LLPKLHAFVRRDLQIAASYRVAFLESTFAILLGLTSMSFFGRLVDQGGPEDLARYGNNYFGFALLGIALTLFCQAVVDQFGSSVRSAQTTGTLEVIVGSRTSLPVFLFCSSAYGLVYAGMRLVLAIAFGVVLFSSGIHLDGVVNAAIVVALTTAAFAGIGILGAAFVLLFKQREPFTRLLMTASLLLSGVLYPTDVLPRWLAMLSPVLPMTHAIEAMRGALLGGSTSLSPSADMIFLAGFALLLPISLAAFEFAANRARIAGSLAHH
jgi:ABC-2 type transport system permease protein